jgi:hypothetical protein
MKDLGINIREYLNNSFKTFVEDDYCKIRTYKGNAFFFHLAPHFDLNLEWHQKIKIIL